MKNKIQYFALISIIIIQNLNASDILFDSDSTQQDTLRGSLVKLAWAEKEVVDVADFVHGRAYCHKNATEKTFKEKATDASIIHLATHAIIDDEHPMYSKLVFTNDTTSKEDGYLHTYELYNMDLKADLAVLSACNTGYGKLIRGEGMMSLARGFMYAGCPSVLMSLWQVDDKTMAEIMKEFYKGLKEGLNKDEALRQAKLNFLEKGDPVKSNPFYWSSLVLVGNNEPIDMKRHFPVPVWAMAMMGLLLTGIAGFIIYKNKLST